MKYAHSNLSPENAAQSKPRLWVLEPRMLFDGAAFATADAISPDDKSDKAEADSNKAVAYQTGEDSASGNSPYKQGESQSLFDVGHVELPEQVEFAMVEVQRLVADFLNHPDALDRLFEIFPGSNVEPTQQWLLAAQTLIDQVNNELMSVRLELLPHATMQGLFGAFARESVTGPTIYLNEGWATHAASTEAVTRILLEEVGHYIDYAINGFDDTPGDEGEHFALRALGVEISDERMARIASDNDTMFLEINGEFVEVQAAALTFAQMYEGTPSSLSEQANRLSNIQIVESHSSFRFTTGDPNQPYFSGNDIQGDLTYEDSSGQSVTINGVLSRLFKSGSTVEGVFFYAPGVDGVIGTADDKAYVLVFNTSFFTVGGSYRSSSDPISGALNQAMLEQTSVGPDVIADTDSATEAAGTDPGTTASGNVLTNDSGDSLAVSAVSFGSRSVDTVSDTTSTSTNPTAAEISGRYGDLVMGDDGTYIYTIDNDNPTVDQLNDGQTLTEIFTYTVTDQFGQTAQTTLTITIVGVTDPVAPPVANPDTNVARESLLTDGTQYSEEDPVGFVATGNVLDNDVSSDPNRQLYIDGLWAQATIRDLADGAIDFGEAELTFAGSQNTNAISDGAVAFLEVGGEYRVLYDRLGQPVKVLEISTTSGIVTAELSGDFVSYFLSSSNGEISREPVNALTLIGSTILFSTAQSSSTVVTSDGGTDRFVTVDGSVTTTSTTVDVGLDVGAVLGDASIVAGMSIAINGVDSGSSVTEVVRDSVSGLVTAIKLNGAFPDLSNGDVLTFTTTDSVTSDYGTFVLQHDGSYTYTPTPGKADFNSGDVFTEVFNYAVIDSAGQLSDDPSSLTITVLGSSVDAPTATDDRINAVEAGKDNLGYNPSGNLLTGVLDGTPPDDLDQSVSADSTLTGTLALTAARPVTETSFTQVSSVNGVETSITGKYGTLVLQRDGTFTYTLDNENNTVNALNIGDSLTEQFVYKVSDGSAEDVAILTVKISGTNDAPVLDLNASAVGTDAVRSYAEGAAAVSLVPEASVLDVDSDAFSELVISFDGSAFNAIGGERLLVGSTQLVDLSTVGDGDSGSFTLLGKSYAFSVEKSASGVVTISVSADSGNLSQIQILDLLDNLNYQASSLQDLSNRVFSISVIDAEDAQSVAATSTVELSVGDLIVSDQRVNEGSEYVVFSVFGSPNQWVSLELVKGTAATADFGPGLQYAVENDDGTFSWFDYDPDSDGGLLQFSADSAVLYIRTAISNNTTDDGPRDFDLVVKNVADESFTGTTIIDDYGRGDIWIGDSVDTATDAELVDANMTRDDDRGFVVQGGTYNEASDFAYFTVVAPAGELLSLSIADGTADDQSITRTNLEGQNPAPSIWYTLDDGDNWVLYSGPFNTGETSVIRVAVDITSEQNDVYEEVKAFELTARYGAVGTEVTAVGTALIKDDGTGDIVLVDSYTVGSELSIGVDPDGNPFLDLDAAKDDDKPSDDDPSDPSTAPVVSLSNGVGAGSSVTFEVPENSTAVQTFTADKTTVTWTLGGADAGLFEIASDGALSFKAAPDFETPGSADDNNTYQVTVIATDGAGNVSQVAVTVEVTNVDELAPAFTSVATATADEGQSALYTAVATDAVDFTDEVVTYSLKADVGDASLLVIDPASGVVSLQSGSLVHATRSSYSFTVIASDATGNESELAVTVTVLDQTAPVVSLSNGVGAGSSVTFEVPENSTAVQTFTTDKTTVTWTLGGADAGLFEIASDGALSFKAAPDFETPGSADDNNTYQVTVIATDGAGNVSQVAVTVEVLSFPANSGPPVDRVAPVGSEGPVSTDPAVNRQPTGGEDRSRQNVDSFRALSESRRSVSEAVRLVAETTAQVTPGTITGEPLALSATTATLAVVRNSASLNDDGESKNRLMTSIQVAEVRPNEAGLSLPLTNSITPPLIVSDRGGPLFYELPNGTFKGGVGRIELNASLISGAPLPQGVSFDSATGLLSVFSPETFFAPLEIRIQASDGRGDTAETIIRIVLGQADSIEGRPTLDEQISDLSMVALD